MRTIIAVVALSLIACSTQAAEPEKKPYTRNVAIVIYNNVQPLDWTGPYEVYNDAGAFGSVNGERAFHVYTVSKKAEVNGQGILLKANYTIADAPKPDIIVFPGGPASTQINDDPEFFAWAKKAALEAEIAQSVCTGAFVLGKAGMLDNRTVTTFYGAIDALQRAYPKANVSDGRRFVDNGNIVTTAGISAGIDGSLHVVARLLGRRVADQTARYMEYHWTPDSYLARDYAYLNPSTDETGRLLQTAAMKREEKDFAGAAATYRAVLESQDANAAAWSGLGEALHEAKQFADAAAAFESAARIAGGHSKIHALYNAACSYAQGGELDRAAERLRTVIESGMVSATVVNADPDLAPLQNHPKLASR